MTKDNIRITHLQSSTQVIQLGEVKVLTDPWLTDGEYYGSWYHYPPFPKQEINNLEYDFIYVSHIHPDHLSEKTFKSLPKSAPVLIHNYDSKFLKRRIEMFGFEVFECDHGKPFEFVNGARITIYAADNCNPELCSRFLGCAIVETNFGSTQIDSLAVFEYGGIVIVNTNDCPFDLAESAIKANYLHKLNADVLLVGYGGAGPFPQCFEFETEDDKFKAAYEKEKRFLDQAINYINLIRPKAFVPFAGTYILGSRLANLTKFRGVPALRDALQYLSNHINGKSKGLLLEQFDVLDIRKLDKFEGEIHFDKTYEEYLQEVSEINLVYDEDKWDDSEIPNLMESAYERFLYKASEIGFSSKTSLVIRSDIVSYQFSTQQKPRKIENSKRVSEPFLEILVDHNLLHRLLRGPRFAHWNNAEIGSHLHFVRKPDIFERGLHYCMNFFHK